MFSQNDDMRWYRPTERSTTEFAVVPSRSPTRAAQSCLMSPVAAHSKVRVSRKLGLRAALTSLVLLTVSVTAIFIHLTWSYTARRNVADVAGQLNQQIVGSIEHEVRGILD